MKPYYEDSRVTLYQGDALAVLREMPAESVHCVVTSPPYWGLRDYGTATWEGGGAECKHGMVTADGPKQTAGVSPNGHAAKADRPGADCHCGARRIDQQLGLESTPEEYVAKMVGVFREVRRVLRSDGVLFLNIGDSYARDFKKGGSGPDGKNGYGEGYSAAVLKPKDLVGIPWMLAFALRADGWWLRQDIIWAKPNPMPESVTDRCTKAHEYLFLLSKSERYWYDQDAIRETGTNRPPGNTGPTKGGRAHAAGAEELRYSRNLHLIEAAETRNKRSVWSIATAPFPEAHFATFPPDLVKPCILAGCPEQGIVLDPFVGSGTAVMVAKQLNRKAIGIDLNADYLEMARPRLSQEVLDFGGQHDEPAR